MTYPILFGNTASAGLSSTNYYGTAADGSVTYSSNTSLVVPNKVGSYDGDMVVMNYDNLTINSGVTLTTDQPCRGMLIYVKNNCNINGTLSMKGRGPYANPTIAGASDGNAVSTNGLQMPFRTSLGSSSLTASASLFNGAGNSARSAVANHKSLNGNGTVITFVRQGANGGSRTGGGTPISPNPGANGGVGQTGGGGSGGGYYNESQAGAGSYGSCFGGGSGGGGTHGSNSTEDATPWGGPGGKGGLPNGGYDTPGGIGNPNGLWASGGFTSNGGINNSNGGTGGLIILIVGGTLTLGGQGLITADGVAGPVFNNQDRGGGGASGGGNVLVAYKTAFINNGGSVTANGGSAWGWGNQIGARGGNGSVQTLQIL